MMAWAVYDYREVSRSPQFGHGHQQCSCYFESKSRTSCFSLCRNAATAWDRCASVAAAQPFRLAAGLQLARRAAQNGSHTAQGCSRKRRVPGIVGAQVERFWAPFQTSVFARQTSSTRMPARLNTAGHSYRTGMKRRPLIQLAVFPRSRAAYWAHSMTR